MFSFSNVVNACKEQKDHTDIYVCKERESLSPASRSPEITMFNRMGQTFFYEFTKYIPTHPSDQIRSDQSLSRVRLCDPVNRSTPGLPVHHQLPEFTETRPSSQWCHPAISSSVIPFSSCPQSLPASESFPMSQLFAWGGQSTGVFFYFFIKLLSHVLISNTRIVFWPCDDCYSPSYCCYGPMTLIIPLVTVVMRLVLVFFTQLYFSA